jgi:hypothetical protein
MGRQNTPSTSPSSYVGRNADSRAERLVAIDAWVCCGVNVGSYARSFCSTVASWARSSSSSDEGAAVFYRRSSMMSF